MQGAIFTLIATLSLAGCGLQAKADKYAPNYAIENDKFIYQQSLIPAQCFTKLMMSDARPNSTAAVFIDDNYLASCMNQSAITDNTSYSIAKILPDHNYNLHVCKAQKCEQIVVAFTSFDYQLNGQTKRLLTVVKRGQW